MNNDVSVSFNSTSQHIGCNGFRGFASTLAGLRHRLQIVNHGILDQMRLPKTRLPALALLEYTVNAVDHAAEIHQIGVCVGLHAITWIA